MESKDLMALIALLPLACIGVLLATFSFQARDAIFLFLVTGAVLSHRMDVNFISHYWYRGTTRGFEASLLDVLALSLLVGAMLRPRYPTARWFWPASLGLMVLYGAYTATSVAFAEPKLLGLFELSKMLRATVVFLAAAWYVRSRWELGLLVVALCCTISLEAAWAVKQRYLDSIHRVPGTLEHPNSLSMYVCLVTPVLVAAANADFPRLVRWFCYAAIASTGLTIILTISRAGIPILFLTVALTLLWCVRWRVTLTKVALSGATALLLGAIVYQSWDTLVARYSSATIAEEYFTDEGEGRGVYFRWAGMILADHPLGVGLNNWSYHVSKTYGPRLGFPYQDYDDLNWIPGKDELPQFIFAAPAHNLAALTVGELGIPGLFLFGLLWLRWFQMGARFLWPRIADPMHRLGVGLFFSVAGIFLQSFTEWTYRQTPILFTFSILLGTLASLYHHRRQQRRQQHPLHELDPVHEPAPHFAPAGN